MESIESEYGQCFIEDGILFFICKEGLELDILSARKISEIFIAIQNGKKHPLCVDISGLADTDKAGRDFMALYSENFCTAVAFIANSELSRIIGNFYLQVNKPVVPTKLFMEKEKALEYLRAL